MCAFIGSPQIATGVEEILSEMLNAIDKAPQLDLCKNQPVNIYELDSCLLKYKESVTHAVTQSGLK